MPFIGNNKETFFSPKDPLYCLLVTSVKQRTFEKLTYKSFDNALVETRLSFWDYTKIGPKSPFKEAHFANHVDEI